LRVRVALLTHTLAVACRIWKKPVGSEPEADLGAETAGGGRTNQDDAWGPRWMLLLVVLVRARAGRLCGVKAQGVGQGMPVGGVQGFGGDLSPPALSQPSDQTC
jgi:hypothetical protein